MIATCAVLTMVGATALATPAHSSGRWPLPKAPVRLVIPDVPAFDAALTGGFRTALRGQPEDGDRLVMAWRRTQVGSKLEAQWSRFSDDLPWTWDEILSLQTRSLALALLDVGHLEAILVVDTPLARIPASPPAGVERQRDGTPYHVVAAGAADGSEDPDRRMGLAWAQLGSQLLIATSERALTLALDTARNGPGYAPPIDGLVSLELDVAALRADRYFRREFLFGTDPETRSVRAALRLEAGQIVEIREGDGPAGPSAHVFPSPGAVAAAWEPDASSLARVLRAGILEPLPDLPDRPRPVLTDLPAAAREGVPDRYMVNIERPIVTSSGQAADEAELPQWRALLGGQSVSGWGYSVEADGGRRIVFPWPRALDSKLVDLCRVTMTRRAGAVTALAQGDRTELRVGPDLASLVVQRTGDYVWIMSPSAADPAPPTPTLDASLTRWARLDLSAVRRESARWDSAEGPTYADETRPLSDRILGILSWMPHVTSLTVERHPTASGWSERVVFGTSGPKESQAP